MNQPTGSHSRPTYYYGRRHSYAYYPLAWTDADTGAHYESGYYDENGRRYDNVAFEENGRYKGVVCHCPYCGQDAILDLGVGDVAAHSLNCQHCGGPMEIRSELDAIVGRAPENTHVYASEASLTNAFPKKKKRRGWLIALLALAALYGIGKYEQLRAPEPSASPLQQFSSSASGGYASVSHSFLYLERQSDGVYRVVTDAIRADRLLVYDRDADSYYDEASDCWLWYNTDVSPAVWQYWYEGISSDYGDCGWMEHEETGWYIEASAGNWIPLPERYDRSGLWWIEN